ncbi:MAG: DNRLRE domain-containing protein [Verrucomicrobiota bacterium]
MKQKKHHKLNKSYLRVGLLLGITLVAVQNTYAQEQVTLTPTQDSDSYQFINAPTTGQSILTLGVSSSCTASCGHSQKTLIQFNTSSIPFASSEVDSAVLRLWALDNTITIPDFGTIGFDPGTVEVYTQGSSWFVDNANPKWNAHDADQFIGSINVSAIEAWYEIDVTQAVKDWLDGASNFGFEIQTADEFSTQTCAFASMEEVESLKPKLVVTKIPVPAPTVFDPVAGFGLEFDAVIGNQVIVSTSDTPEDGTFTDMSPLTITTSPFSIVDPMSLTLDKRFYTIRYD